MNVKRHTEARRRSGFTLVEVVIVIGLIVLLAGLVLSVSVSVVRGSEVRQTEQVLLLLDSALKEWEASSERKISWGVNGEPSPPGTAQYDMQRDTAYVLKITECLETITRVSQVKSVIALIDPQFVHTYDSSATTPPWILQIDPSDPNGPDAPTAFNSGALDGMLSVLDAWGRPIRVVHPGRVANPLLGDDPAEANPDGTIQLVLETACGVATNRQILFISAGPDGEFGDLNNGNPKALEQTMDNVISYSPIDQ